MNAPTKRRLLVRGALASGVVAAVLAFHWRAAMPGMAFAGDDIWLFFIAEREAVADAMRHLMLPQWERGIFLGFPLVGDPQAAIFDPATLLTLPFDAPRALTMGTFVHLLVMGWGMVVWARLRGLGVAEALLAAVLFALGAKQTVHLHHWNFAASTAWWPWMLAAVEGFASDGRRRWLWALAASTALSWFGGSPQMAYFGTLVAGFYVLVVLPSVWARQRTDVVRLALALGAGLLLASPLLLPVAELARYGPRGESGLGYEFATSWKWPDRWALALLLVPKAYTSDTWPGAAMNLWEATGYVGILPLGLIAATRLRKRGVPFLLVLLVVGVWLSFGEDAWLGIHRELYEVLPGFGKFRVPTRSLMVTSFAAAMLSAEGLHNLRTAPKPRAALARAAVILLATVGAALALPYVESSLDAAAVARESVTCVALGAIGIVWIAAGLRWRLRLAWALGAVAITAADLYVAFGDMNRVIASAQLRPVLEQFEPNVPPAGSPRRIASALPNSPNDTQRLRWEGVFGYGPTMIERVRRLVEATRHGSLTEQGDANQLMPMGDPASPLWPLMATPLAVTVGSTGFPIEAELQQVDGPPIVLQRVPALPRVYWTGAFVVADDPAVEMPLLDAARGDRAVVASVPPVASGPPAGPVPAASVVIAPRTLDAVVVAPRDGLAVVVDPWFPGWEASVDGQATPILRANYAFQAIPVTAGVHRLKLTYRSRPLRQGFALALVGLTTMAALTWRRRSIV